MAYGFVEKRPGPPTAATTGSETLATGGDSAASSVQPSKKSPSLDLGAQPKTPPARKRKADSEVSSAMGSVKAKPRSQVRLSQVPRPT